MAENTDTLMKSSLHRSDEGISENTSENVNNTMENNIEKKLEGNINIRRTEDIGTYSVNQKLPEILEKNRNEKCNISSISDSEESECLVIDDKDNDSEKIVGKKDDFSGSVLMGLLTRKYTPLDYPKPKISGFEEFQGGGRARCYTCPTSLGAKVRSDLKERLQTLRESAKLAQEKKKQLSSPESSLSPSLSPQILDNLLRKRKHDDQGNKHTAEDVSHVRKIQIRTDDNISTKLRSISPLYNSDIQPTSQESVEQESSKQKSDSKFCIVCARDVTIEKHFNVFRRRTSEHSIATRLFKVLGASIQAPTQATSVCAQCVRHVEMIEKGRELEEQMKTLYKKTQALMAAEETNRQELESRRQSPNPSSHLLTIPDDKGMSSILRNMIVGKRGKQTSYTGLNESSTMIYDQARRRHTMYSGSRLRHNAAASVHSPILELALSQRETRSPIGREINRDLDRERGEVEKMNETGREMGRERDAERGRNMARNENREKSDVDLARKEIEKTKERVLSREAQRSHTISAAACDSTVHCGDLTPPPSHSDIINIEPHNTINERPRSNPEFNEGALNMTYRTCQQQPKHQSESEYDNERSFKPTDYTTKNKCYTPHEFYNKKRRMIDSYKDYDEEQNDALDLSEPPVIMIKPLEEDEYDETKTTWKDNERDYAFVSETQTISTLYEMKTSSTGYKSYICKLCHIDVQTRKGIECHVKCHIEGSRSLRCYLCGYINPKLPTQWRIIRYHLIQEHSLGDKIFGRLSCPEKGCDYVFHSSDVLGKHLFNSHSIETQNGEKDHRLRSTGLFDYPCKACGTALYSQEQLDIHMKCHGENSKSYICYLCKYCHHSMPGSWRFMKGHLIKEHIPNDTPICDFSYRECEHYGCKEKFSSVHARDIHANCHTPRTDNMFHCSICDYRLSSPAFWSTIKQHILSTHSFVFKGPFHCTCDRSFDVIEDFRSHINKENVLK